MTVFEYSVKNGLGQVKTGEILAESAREAVRSLRQQDLFVIRLQEKALQAFHPQNFKGRWGGRQRVSSKDLIAFTNQLGTLIRAGVPLLECLDLLGAAAENSKFKRSLAGIRSQVENGSLLAAALARYPEFFSPLFLNLVEVGETTGRLEESLARLGQYLEKQAQLRAKIFTSLAYPALLVSVAVSVLIFLCVWVVPMFSELFSEMGEALPWLTQAVIEVAHGVQDHGLILIGLAVLAVTGAKRLWRQPRGREILEGVLLRVPLLGPVLRKAAVVRLARTLGSLVRYGVPLLQALGMTREVIGNSVLEKGLSQACRQVEQGIPLSEALKGQGEEMFPALFTHMLRVGESTGSLDGMLDKVADVFEQEVDRSVITMTALVEPAIILVVGAAIAVVVIAMYLPIFSMGSVIASG